MARRKDAKALFEVIKPGSGKGDKPLGVPGWFGQAKPAAGVPVLPAVPPPGQPPAEVGGPMTGGMPAGPLPVGRAMAPPSSEAEPLLQVSGERLRISLNHISAAVVVLAVFCLIAGAFYLGKRAGAQGVRAAGQNPGSVVTQGTPAQPVYVPASPIEPENAAPVGNAERKKGYNYLIIASRIGSRETASQMQAFLGARGVETTIEPMDGKMFCIKDIVGFTETTREPAVSQIEQRKALLERIGKEYRKQGGDYDFSKPYLKKEE